MPFTQTNLGTWSLTIKEAFTRSIWRKRELLEWHSSASGIGLSSDPHEIHVIMEDTYT